MSKTTLEKVFSNKYVQLAALAAGGLALLRTWNKNSVSGVGEVIRSSFYEAEILSDEGNYKVIFSVIPRSGNIRAEIYQRTASYISPENYDPQKMVEWFHWGTEYGRSIEEAFNKADSFVARAGGHINLNDIKNL